MRAIKKAVMVEFEIYDGSSGSVHKIIDMYGQMSGILNTTEGLYIETPGNSTMADRGDYIIKDMGGSIYPVKPEVFEKTYDVVDSNIIDAGRQGVHRVS